MPNIRFLVLLLTFYAVSSTAQEYDYLFDFASCDAREANNSLAPGLIIGDPKCVCGLENNSLELSGDDSVLLPEELKDLMKEDFTLEFYFLINEATTLTDIFSIRSSCTLDSMMSITYIPQYNRILFEAAEAPSRYHSIFGNLNPDLCWHEIAITKQGLEYSLYLDGQYVNTFLAALNIPLGSNAIPSFANSPCIVVDQERLNGRIDEFKFYRRALSTLEIKEKYLYPDQIITRDTTIFKGDAIDIKVGASCYDDFNWSPGNELVDDQLLEPTSKNEETVTFTLTSYTGSCVANDEVTIYVIDENDIDCNDLKLPSAFTPNGDGLNDTYGISNTFVIDSLEYFEIYDRWGSRVFNTQQINQQWDGSFSGQPVNPGMFLYKIKFTCKGEQHIAVDNFSVLR